MPEKELYQKSAADVIEAIFPGRNFGTKIPAEAFATVKIEGIQYMVVTTATARTWGKTMRVYAFCPKCHRRYSASRLDQHLPSCKGTK